MANMNDIAKMAGVSLGTVSNVLNNSAIVREALQKRVHDAVQATGYQPSQLARGLRRVKTNVIGMIIPDIMNPFFPAVVRGAEDVAFSNGHRLILCNTDNDHSKELVHLNELRTYLPAGLIVIPSNFSDLTAQAESYRQAGTGVVCIDRLPKNWSGDTVTADNEAGAYNATRYLLHMRHTRLYAAHEWLLKETGEPRAHAGDLLPLLQLLPRASDAKSRTRDGSWNCRPCLDD
jgi:LacI family transcriptional regulator